MTKINDIRAANLARYFYQLAEQSRDVFWIRGHNYKDQMYISPTFEDSWGISTQSLYDNPSLWMSAVHPDDRDHVKAINDQNLMHPPRIGEIVEKNYRIVRPDNTVRWIKDTSFGLYDENNECFGFAGICKDISNDVLHKQELEEAKQHAEMANQAKADFLAKMSHEFRTPLNAIIGMTQIMQKKGLTAEQEEYVSLISQAGNSLLSLVNDILDFAKIEIGELSFANDPLDLHLLISQVVHSFKYQAEEKNTCLSLDYSDSAPRFVMGDAKRIRQILVNLISNAIKFTEDGEVNISVDYEQANGPSFIFSVKDNGIGIEESKHHFIFEKFSQVETFKHRKQQGTGLGLAITKQLVERIGGKITVESTPDVGSTFTFTLPLTLQETHQQKRTAAVKEEASEPIKTKQLDLKILLVEDNYINQRIVKYMLDDLGCTLDIANDGVEAFSYINQQTYDVILMDIGLPDMDGFEVTAKIRTFPALNNIPIIAMTAHALECDQEKCFASGMNHIVIKPIRFEELYEILKAYSKAQ